MMKLKEYENIVTFIKSHAVQPYCPRQLLSQVIKNFHVSEKLSYDTILSIFLTTYQQCVKTTYPINGSEENAKKYFSEYADNLKKSLENQSNPGAYKNVKNDIIILLGQKYDVPPALMARLIVQEYVRNEVHFECLKSHKNQVRETDDGTSEITSLKIQLSQIMKQPERIEDVNLKTQVLQAFYHDICYGTINDAIRGAVGLEYESKLLNGVKNLNLPYLVESDLQKRGYDKTPDVKLEVPIIVKSHVVCWIESKASFGDIKSHNQYLREQYYSYWNRFGPGLVIYWFGFIEELSDNMKDQGILLMDSFPVQDEIIFQNPKLIKPNTELLQNNAFL